MLVYWYESSSTEEENSSFWEINEELIEKGEGD